MAIVTDAVWVRRSVKAFDWLTPTTGDPITLAGDTADPSWRETERHGANYRRGRAASTCVQSTPRESRSSMERLRARDVCSAALRTYREQFRRVASTAFVVFGTIAAIDAVSVVLVVDHHVPRPVGAAITSVAAGVLAMSGVVIYAGILDRVVGAHLHGHPNLTIRQILDGLPLRRLIAADVVLALATLVGLALFVVPGVAIFTMWSLVGPVITIEDRSVASALTRSGRLVRGHFWLTLVLVTLPLQIEQTVLHAVHYAELFDHPVVPAFLVNGMLGMVVGSVVGLVEVVLAYDLIARQR